MEEKFLKVTDAQGVSTTINLSLLEELKAFIRAINHPLRRKLLQVLSENGKLTVTEIYVKLRLEQSVCSQHLRMLREQGVLKTEREGKFIFYSVDSQALNERMTVLENWPSQSNNS